MQRGCGGPTFRATTARVMMQIGIQYFLYIRIVLVRQPGRILVYHHIHCGSPRGTYMASRKNHYFLKIPMS